MKFIAATIAFFAIVIGVQSAVLPSQLLGLGASGIGLGLNPLGLAPVGLGINGLILGVGGINGLGLNGLLKPVGLGYRSDLTGIAAIGIPEQSLSQGPVTLADHGIISPGATYVAQTPGVIHTAPLDGHINSAVSLNMAPAAGHM